MGSTNTQIAAEISNNVAALIPVGTLSCYGNPGQYALQGVEVSPKSHWVWLDAPFLYDVYSARLHPALAAVVYLCRLRYASATIKTLRVHHRYCIWVIRVYLVPLDISRARHLRQWRSSVASKSQIAQFKKHWSVLRDHMDYTSQSWYLRCPPVLLVPIVGKHATNRNGIGRWLSAEDLNSLPLPLESLKTLVKEIYDGVDFSEARQSLLHDLPTSSDFAAPFYSDGQISGVKTELYPFQLQSVLKMYQQETSTIRANVPSLIPIISPTGATYHYDIALHQFLSLPEIYTLPKGGILAENMGLGKTLICLSLVCLSRHETTTYPRDMLLQPPESCRELLSLAHLAIKTILQEGVPWKLYEQDMPANIVSRLHDNPGFFEITQAPRLKPSRSYARDALSTKRYYLSSSTIIVAPENLLHQWRKEMESHLHKHALKVLFLSDRFVVPLHNGSDVFTSTIPESVPALIRFDIVVITALLLMKSAPSAIFSIYWKRLIIDEGHSMNSRTSNLGLACKTLLSERRWAVTGTPTSGLTNLHMDESPNEDVIKPATKRRKYIIKNTLNERDELLKLGTLVSNFFKIEPFAKQPTLWNSSIVQNLLGPFQQASKASLSNLLNSLMIRHNQAQVEQTLTLPALHHKAVFLEPSLQNKLSMNLFTAVLAVNAVTSERTGSDYMFHPLNSGQLRKLVGNLQMASFYWTGFQRLDVKSLVDIIKKCFLQHDSGEKAYSSNDLSLLQQALRSAETALANPTWVAASMIHEMFLFVADLPHAFVTHFGSGNLGGIGIYGARQASAIQKFFYKNRFMNMQDNVLLTERLAPVTKQFWESYWDDLENKKSKANAHDNMLRADLVTATWDRSISPGHFEEIGYRHSTAPTQMKPSFHNANARNAQILGTASAKLSYLASRLVQHQKEGVKSLVFFEYEESAYYLTEVLDILGVKYIIYATFIGAERRANSLGEFAAINTESEGGVSLIMDLKLASHGLTITSATNVYFMNPVWSRHVEAQAIKRAHRIGQTKEVCVETLVLSGTLELEIYQNRHQQYGNDTIEELQHQQVVDNVDMQRFLTKYQFLDVGPDSEVCEFVTPMDHSMIPAQDTSAEEYQLEPHTFSEQNAMCKWRMHLFNPNNMQLLAESRRDKPGLEQLNSELVSGEPKEQRLRRPQNKVKSSC